MHAVATGPVGQAHHGQQLALWPNRYTQKRQQRRVTLRGAPRTWIGGRRIGQHGFARAQCAAKQGIEFAKCQARPIRIGIGLARGFVPRQVGEGVHLKPGRFGAVVKHLAHKTVGAVREGQQIGQQRVECRTVVVGLNETGLRPADGAQQPVLAVQRARGFAVPQCAADLRQHDRPKPIVRGLHHIVGKALIQRLRGHRFKAGIDRHQLKHPGHGQFGRQGIAIWQLMVDQQQIHPLSGQRQPSLVERADVHELPGPGIVRNVCTDAVCRRSQPTYLENDDHGMSPKQGERDNRPDAPTRRA